MEPEETPERKGIHPVDLVLMLGNSILLAKHLIGTLCVNGVFGPLVKEWQVCARLDAFLLLVCQNDSSARGQTQEEFLGMTHCSKTEA